MKKSKTTKKKWEQKMKEKEPLHRYQEKKKEREEKVSRCWMSKNEK